MKTPPRNPTRVSPLLVLSILGFVALWFGLKISSRSSRVDSEVTDHTEEPAVAKASEKVVAAPEEKGATEQPSAPTKNVKFVSTKPRVALPPFDKRNAPLAPQVSAVRLSALAALRQEIPGVQVEFDSVSGAPSYVQATGRFLSAPLAPGQPARAAAEQFVDRHQDLFGHDATALKRARVVREDVAKHSGMTTLVWNQEVNGIPVFKTILKANVTRMGELITLNSHFLPEPLANRAVPAFGATDAISKAAASLSDQVAAAAVKSTTQASGAEQFQRFTAPGQSDTTAQLTYLPMDEQNVRLGWDVTTFSLAQNEMFRMVVDAESGEVLYRTSLTADISDATYRVFTGDSPSPFSPGHDNISSVQPAEVARQLVTLQALDTTASPEGWIPDGGTQTLGNNVDAHTDTDANNSPDLPRPTSSSRVFDFTADLTQAPSTYKDASVTNLFYWSNIFHDKMYQLGFTESAGNFQTNNFGRGGLGNDPVQADAQDGSGTDNANFSTPPDGSPGRMQMYLWTGPTPDRDGDFEMEVVLHELAHGVSNRLVGGGVGISANATAGMGEGWSDFYGLSMLAEPGDNLNGNWARGAWSRYEISAGFHENYYYGGRRYPYSVNKTKNPLTLQDIDPSKARAHSGIPRHPYVGNTADQVHNMGNVWCVALWEVRKNLIVKHGFSGNQLALQLVTDGMKLSPANPNFLQARDGIIQADLVNNAGANSKELWAGFAKRGMGLTASAPVPTVSIGVNESYDVPGTMAVTPVVAFNPIGLVGGPMSPTSQVFTITNNGGSPLNWTAAKTQTWTDVSPTSGTIAPGGTATVTWSINAGANALPFGEQQDELTITDTATNAVQTRPMLLEINASPVAQTITFPPLSPKATTDAPFALTATASSGLPVSYTVLSGPATVSGSTVTLTGATGAVTIKASQPGNALFLAATDVTRTFVVGAAFQFAKVFAQSAASITYAIKSDGTLWSWGAAVATGNLGDTNTTGRVTPTQVGTATNWVEVSGQSSHWLGLTSDGKLWAWGFNLSSQLGDGTTTTRTAPTQIGVATNWSKVSAGANHSAAVRTDGTLWAWGSNTSGQLGLNDTTTRTTPTQVGTATNWAAVACGTSHTIAVTTTGELWTWGLNTSSQLGDGTTTQSLVPVRIGTATDWSAVSACLTSSYAMKSGGTLWAWGSNAAGQLGDGTTVTKTTPTQIGTVTTWVQLVSGGNNAAGRRSDGTVWIWGSNTGGQLGNGSTTLSSSPVQFGSFTDLSSVALGINHCTVLRSDGTLWTAGEASSGTGVWPRGIALASANTNTFTSLTGGNQVFHAVRSDGTAWSWGAGSTSNLGSGTTGDQRTLTQIGALTDWKQIADGTSHALAVKLTGTLWAWGTNSFGQLGNGTTTTTATPTQIGTNTDWTRVAGGGSHSLAVTTGGTLWAWGLNSSSQLGDGTTTQRTAPVQIGTATNWSKIAAGSSHSLGITTAGTLFAWGLNTSNQLGDGTTTTRTAPTQIGSATNWVEVAAGASHSLGLRSDGTLWSWGSGAFGQLGSGATTNRTTPTQVGTDTNWAKISANAQGNTTIAIKTDGSLWVCGVGTFGQNGDGNVNNLLTLTRIGTDTSWTVAAASTVSLAAFRQGTGFFTAGASSGARGMAGTRDSRIITPILPALQPQSLNALASSYSTHQSPVSITTTSGLIPTVQVLSGPATVSGNQVTLLGNGTVTLLAYSYGDDAAWNAIPPTRLSFTSGSALAVTFPSLGSVGLTSNGFDARNVVLNATLGFAPTLGTTLTLVNNTGSGAITGTIPGLPDGGYLTMTFGGVTYGFRVDYTGGDGNDIVLTHELAPQTITIAQINPKETTDVPFTVSATATSGEPVSLSVVTGPASVLGNTITLTGAAGAVTIKASQAGNSLFTAAPDVLHTFAVGTNVKFASVSTWNHTVAVGTNGWLWSTGSNASSQLGDGLTATKFALTRVGTAANWSKVSAGSVHSLAVKTDGTLWAWGSNANNQLGDGTTTTRTTPTQIGAVTNWASVHAGRLHSLARRTDGTIWGWGFNGSGENGDGTTVNKTTPTQIGTATDWAVLAAGEDHGLAIKTSGTLWGWGANGNGQVGDGSTTNRLSPVQIGTDTNWSKVSAATSHSLAVKTDGTLWAWGANTSGQLGDGTTTQRTSPVQVGFAADWANVFAGPSYSRAIKTDGSVWVWGTNGAAQLADGTITNRTSPQRLGTATDWSSLSGGALHTIGLKTDGSLYTWGDGGASGAHGLSPRAFARAMAPGNQSAISAGATHAVVQRGDGTMVAFGTGTSGQLGNGTTSFNLDPTQIGTVSTWALVRAGNLYSTAVRTDGTLWGWGTNGSSQLGDGTITTRTSPTQIGTATDWSIVAPSGGGSHTLAIKTGGTLWAWGLGTSNQLGDGAGTTRSTPTQIGTDTTWAKVVPGSSHSLGLKADGTLWAWGLNSSNQLGDGTTTTRTTPTQIGTDTTWAQISTFTTSSYGLKTNGTLWAWGSNTSGQLGMGDTTNRTTPTQVGTDTTWLSVSAGSTHAAGIKSDGSLWVWGSNSIGQLGDGTTTNATTPVRLGTSTGWVAVSCGTQHTIALRNDGSIWTAGNAGGLRLASTSGRSPYVAAAVVPSLSPQTINTTPIGTNPYRFTASSGLPVQLSLVSGQATITGDEINVTGPPGSPVVVLAWQPGDETAWNAAGPHQIVIGTLSPPTIDSIAHANVDGSGADLSATVNPNGGLTTVSFRYGTSPTLATFSTSSSVSAGNGSTSAPTSLVNIGGLSELTTYYYQAVATSAGGTTMSGIQSFTTLQRDIAIEQPSGTARTSGDTIAYGDVNLGSSLAQTFVIKDTVPGTAVTFGPIALSGADAGMFSLNTTGTGSSVTGGGSTSFTVTFTPTLSGARTATLTIPNNDPDENPFTLTLTANGVAAPGPTQTILGPSTIANRFVADGAFTLGYVASSGLPVTYQIVGGSGGSVSGTTFTPNANGGPVTLRISQAGGSGYDPATDVYRTFTVALGKFSKIAAGPTANHGLGIKTDGTLWAWGANDRGQLGDGTTTDRYAPVKIGTATTWNLIAVGADFSVAVQTNGTLWVWGANTSSQLGLGDTTDRTVPTQLGALTTWSTVAAGRDFVIARQTTGTLWSWGANSSGQLGLGDTTTRTSPVQIGALTTWSNIAAGSGHALAVQSTGTLWGWGLNTNGQIGDGSTTSRMAPVQVGVATNWSTTAGMLACGATSSYAINALGNLWAWGDNSSFQLGDGTSTQRINPTQIGTATTWYRVAAGTAHGVGLQSAGTSLYAWGTGSYGANLFGSTTTVASPSLVTSAATWSAIAAGNRHSLAVDSSGNLSSGGNNSRGQLGNPPPSMAAISTTPVTSFSHGDMTSHFTLANGTLWGLGMNTFGQVGDGTTTRRQTPVQVGSATTWGTVVDGGAHAIALRTDGTLWGWGSNSSGAVGDGTTTSRTAPVQVGAVTTWTKIAAGSSHSAGIRSDGTLWTWGSNTSGQLGDGSTTTRTAPVQVGTATDWAQVSLGSSHTLALKSNGTLWVWGLASSGQLGDGTTTQKTSPTQIGTDTTWIALSAGSFHSLGLKSDGTLWAWGLNNEGQLGDGTITNRLSPVQVASGLTSASIKALAANSLVLRSDGTVSICGSNQYGQLLDRTVTAGYRATFAALGGLSSWGSLGTGRGNAIHLATVDGRLWATGSNIDSLLTNALPVFSTLSQAHPGVAEQQITATIVNPVAYGTPVTLTSTANSGLPLNYYLASGPATLSGNQLTVTGPGLVKLYAHQPGAMNTWQSSGLQQITVTGVISAPTVVTASHSAVTGTTATLSGTVNPNGGSTDVSFRWGTDPTLTTATVTTPGNIGAGTGDVPLTPVSLTGLLPGTTYYYRVSATNSAATTLGTIQNFTTPAPDIQVEYPPATPLVSGASSIAFGSGTLGASPSVFVITVRSTVSGTTLNVGTPTLTGANADDFSLDLSTLSSAVAGGTSTTFSVAFKPLLAGARTATLSIPSTDPDENPFTLTLTGTGVAVGGPSQSIFGPATLAQRFLSGGAFALPFGATSGLPLTVEVVGGSSATVSGNSVTPVSGGPVTLKITQPGGSGYDAAEAVYRTVQIVDGQFVKLAQGSQGSHMLGIKSDGTLWGWGNNTDGEVGDGTSGNMRRSPVRIGTATNWVQATVGSFSSAAVRSDGTLWAWGYGGSGSLGLGDFSNRLTPTQVGTGTNWASVAMGSNFTLAIKTDGTLWACGANSSSQLGDGTALTRTTFVQIGTATNWASVSGGSTHALATRTDGTLWAWGANATSQLGLGDTATRSTPTQVGTGTTWSKVAAGTGFSLALRTDGTLWAWGTNTGYQLGLGDTTTRTSPTQVGVLTTWQSISVGTGHGQAVRTDGSLWAWSGTANGQNGSGSTSSRSSPTRVGTANDWLAVSCFSSSTIALKSDGTLHGAGANWFGHIAYPKSFPTPMATGGISAISLGNWRTHFIRSDGTLWGVGTNFSDLGDGTTTPRSQPVQIGTATTWTSIAGGTQHSIALQADGTLWAEGANSSGPVGDGTTTTRLSFIQIGSVNTWTKVAAGSTHSVALRSDGTLWTWGLNSLGQLGLGDVTNRTSPTQVGAATDWSFIAAGGSQSFAIKTDGTLWACGANSSGQLGDGSTTTRTSFIQIGTATDWSRLAAGSGHTLALKTNGTLWAWGTNTSSQLGDGTSINRTTPTQIGIATDWALVFAGSTHSIAKKANGELWGWGNNTLGVLGTATEGTVTSPALIAGTNAWDQLAVGSGTSFSVASTSDGTLWGWGINADTQLTDTARRDSIFEYVHPTIVAQTITFPTITVTAYNTPIPLNATASSGLPVSYYVSGPAIVSNNALTVTGPGPVKLLAYQAGERPAWHNAPMVQASIVSPEIAIEQPAGTDLSDGSSTLDFAGSTVSTPVIKTFTLKNVGTATLSGISGNIDGTHASDFTLGTLPTSLAASGSATFTVTFTPPVIGTRNAVLHITSNDPDESPFDITLTGAGLTAYQAAQQVAGISGTADPLGDADGDGVTNLMELAFGSNPGAGSSGTGVLQYSGGFAGGGTIITNGQPITAQEPAPNTVDVRAIFVRRKDASPLGITYTVQFSANLTTWQSSTVTPTVLADDGTYEVVSVPYPFFIAMKKVRFFHVIVNVTP